MDSTLQDQIITDIAKKMSDDIDRQLLGVTLSDDYQLVYDVGTVYGKRYYTVHPVLEPDWINPHKHQVWADMLAWTIETFGTSNGSIWAESTAPEPGERWYVNNAKFWFRDQRDRDWFTLRWSS
jgi:hypothetical protein